MESIIEFMKTDLFLIIISAISLLLLIGLIVSYRKISRLNKRYKEFMQKLGNGKNIEEDLENYMYRVERAEKQSAEAINYCKNLDNDISRCIQKIGIVRYNAFKDTGSDLSFAVALLDEKNNGVVFNGIYSREMSNIYAKPVENGKSSYTVSNEEQMAIDKAINSDDIYKIR